MGIDRSTIPVGILSRKHAHNEARRAVPTLRATVVHHRLLYCTQMPAGTQGLDGPYLPFSHSWKRDQAAVDCSIGCASDSFGHYQDGACPALAFRTAFLSSGQSPRPNELEQGSLGQDCADPNVLAVQDETEAIAGRRHNEC